MKFSCLLFGSITSFAALIAAAPDASSFSEALSNPLQDVSLLNPRDLDKRACVPNGCKCGRGTKPGVYCGNCDAVIKTGSNASFDGYVFQCAKNGDCCCYGKRTSCKYPSKTPCGG